MGGELGMESLGALVVQISSNIEYVDGKRECADRKAYGYGALWLELAVDR